MKKERAHMPIADRAKQFMPFAALKGYEEALRAKEKIVVPRAELTEDAAEVLDRKLHMIQPNDLITVIYYSGNEYIQLAGMISKIDLDSRLIKIVNKEIPLDSLYDIQGEQFNLL